MGPRLSVPDVTNNRLADAVLSGEARPGPRRALSGEDGPDIRVCELGTVVAHSTYVPRLSTLPATLRLSLSRTRPTSPTAAGIDAKVVTGQLVAVLAVRLGRPSTPEVLLPGHRLQVGRIDARPIAAQVVNLHPRGDGPNIQLVRRPVCVGRRSVLAAEADAPISVTTKRGRPQPAVRDWVVAPLVVQPVHQAAANHPHNVSPFSPHATHLPKDCA